MELFSTFRLGKHTLKNRMVMAPMTRSRALGNIPNELMRDYYAQRASAGLLVTEGIAPSPNALGYARIPGLYSQQQVAGFREVTTAVHEQGGYIFAQLMHVGRIGHPLNLPDKAHLVAPSAVRAEGMMWTDQEGPQPHPEPEALTLEEVRNAKNEFVDAAKHAIEAGFDGIELHAANGYLLNQFLHPHTNRRSDAYGGSPRARARFVLEVAEATSDAIGADRVGIRFSPYGTFNDLPEDPETDEQYRLLARSLKDLVYIHVINNPHPGFSQTLSGIRQEYSGALIRNGGFDAQSAEKALLEKQADLVSFGRPFLANPDLPARYRAGRDLNEPKPDTFYTPGPEGYLDYPTSPASVA